MSAPLELAPLLQGRKLNEHPGAHSDYYGTFKKFPLNKINVTKNELFFSRTPTHHSFNSRFLYELKHKVCLSKTVCGVFHFNFRLVFIKVNIFVQQKA